MKVALGVVGCLAFSLSGTSLSSAETDDSSDFTVCVVPLGKHDERLLGPIVRGIEQLYGVEVKRLDAHQLPKTAYYAPRKRYRAEKLIDYINEKVAPESGCSRVIGFTSVDISTTKDEHVDWGIFGLAQIGGPSGVVSTFRLRRKASRRKLAIRSIKVVNHELGHALGSDHVVGKGCLMEDGAGTIKTVDGERGTLCDDTIGVIEKKSGLTLPQLERFDWDKAIKP